MDMRSAWFSKLQATNPEVRLIATIGLGRLSEIDTTSHPGTWGRVIRASSHQNVDIFSVQSGASRWYPFWPSDRLASGWSSRYK